MIDITTFESHLEHNNGSLIRSFIEDEDNNIIGVVEGEIQINGILKPAASLLKIEPLSGSILSENFYQNINIVNSPSINPQINAIQQFSDGSIVTCGEIMDGYFASPTAGYWGWLMRTDANGNAPGQVTRISPAGNEGTKVVVYPDPASTQITFSCTLPKSEIHIYDLAGKELDILLASEQTVWETHTQAAGMYFYTLIQAGRVIEAGKFIIQK